MPAYNEVENIQAAYEGASRAIAKAGILDYEIIIITNDRQDGTNDGTPALADRITARDRRVRRIHNHPYVNLGYKYRQGVQAATKTYVMMIPGDNETEENSVADILSHLGEADMVITYTLNKEARAWKRRLVSWCFTTLCNLMFGLHLKYFNGIAIHPRRYLQAIPMRCDNFAYMAEILVYLIKSGVSYIEVPQVIKPTSASAAFKLKSAVEAFGTLLSLFWKIHFRRERVIA